MNEQPILQTARLTLRPFLLSDAKRVQTLAGDRAVADTTINIPHPFEDGMAEKWIAGHQSEFEAGERVTFAVVLREKDILIGAIGLRLCQRFQRAGLGYWIGIPYWKNGYCTEAGAAILQYGFEILNLHRIHAFHVVRNPASGRVLHKLGMNRKESRAATGRNGASMKMRPIMVFSDRNGNLPATRTHDFKDSR